MGVRGLHRFLEDAGAYKRVYLHEALQEQPDKLPRLVVDGLSLCHYIRNHCGGFPQLFYFKAFRNYAVKYLQSLLSSGLDGLLVVFDGTHEPIKHHTRRERRASRWATMKAYLAEVDRGESVNSTAVDLTSIQLYRHLLVEILHELKVDVFVALGEADTEIARLALSRNYFGVLAEDSDYHILGVNYISLKSLGFVDEDDTVYATCKLYLPEKIKQTLSIDPKHYHLLAALVGCDYLSSEELEGIHNKIGVAKAVKGSPIIRIKKILTYIRNEYSEQAFAKKVGQILSNSAAKRKYGSGVNPTAQKLDIIRQKYTIQETTEDTIESIGIAPFLQFANSAEFVTQYQQGRVNAVVFGVARSSMNWLSVLPVDPKIATKATEFFARIRARSYGAILWNSELSSSGKVQEDSVYGKSHQIPLVSELPDLKLEELIASSYAHGTSREWKLSRFCIMLLGEPSFAIKVYPHSDSFITMAVVLRLLRQFLDTTSCSALDEQLFDDIMITFAILQNPAYAKKLSDAHWGGWAPNSVSKATAASILQMAMENAIVCNQLCGLPLSIKMDELFDGSLFQHLGAVRDLYPDASIKQLRETVESK